MDGPVRFLGWLGVGAGLALSLLGAMTIGVFVLPLALLATALLARSRNASQGLGGLISGLGLPLLYVAYLNRSGPGTVCTVNSDHGQSCSSEWSPWPWLGLGLAFVIAGIVWSVRARRRRVNARTTAP